MRYATCVTLLGVLAGAGCAPSLTVGATATSDLRPAAYRSYHWDLADSQPTGDPRLDNNPFFVEQLTRAVDGEMVRHGLNKVASGGDLIVHTHATIRDRVDVWATDRRAGYDLRGYQTENEVRQYEEGTIIVDIAETANKRLIWRGWIQTDVTGAIGKDELMARRVKEGMSRLFLQFPQACVGTC